MCSDRTELSESHLERVCKVRSDGITFLLVNYRVIEFMLPSHTHAHTTYTQLATILISLKFKPHFYNLLGWNEGKHKEPHPFQELHNNLGKSLKSSE